MARQGTHLVVRREEAEPRPWQSLHANEQRAQATSNIATEVPQRRSTAQTAQHIRLAYSEAAGLMPSNSRIAPQATDGPKGRSPCLAAPRHRSLRSCPSRTCLQRGPQRREKRKENRGNSKLKCAQRSRPSPGRPSAFALDTAVALAGASGNARSDGHGLTVDPCQPGPGPVWEGACTHRRRRRCRR